MAFHYNKPAVVALKKQLLMNIANKPIFTMSRIRLFSVLLLFFGAAALLPSCKDFEGSQTVPAYIRIDSIGLSCDYYVYGANTTNFTDAWVYIDEDILKGGIVELPAVLPVLQKGKHKVSVRAGINVNGIKGTKSDYPFLATLDYPEVDLVPDSIITFNPVVTYYPISENQHVSWMEDFDQGGMSLVATSGSDTSLMRVSGPLAWHDPNGTYSTYSGKVVLTSDTMAFTIATADEVTQFTEIPTKGSPCMLEMDYKCSDTLLMGLVFVDRGVSMEYPVLRIRPTGESGQEPTEWKKIYINVGPYLVDNEDYDFSKIYFASWSLRNDGTQYFYFDNLKLIYRDR